MTDKKVTEKLLIVVYSKLNRWETSVISVCFTYICSTLGDQIKIVNEATKSLQL